MRPYIPTDPMSKLAVWARRIAGFAFAATFLAIIVVRSGVLEIKPAAATFAGALAIAVLALLVALAAFAVIWMEGLAGMRAALTAMAISLLILPTRPISDSRPTRCRRSMTSRPIQSTRRAIDALARLRAA